MAGYWAFSVEVAEEDSEALQGELYEMGCLGCEIRDSSALPMPGQSMPASGRGRIIAYFSEQAAISDEVRTVIAVSWPALRPEFTPVEQRDWSNEWRARIRSATVGKIWVGPPWQPTPAELIRVAIEPKMAFGTGDHPSTALCLEAIQEHLARFSADSCLDVGTGSGVLAIAARKLNARPVVAVDNDPVCVTSARDNAALNGTPDISISDAPVARLTGQFGLVVANILANTLIEMAPVIVPRVGRRLSLAGILRDQRAEVEDAYRRSGLLPRGNRMEGDWLRLDFERR
jgi:ribosomal protein L11 methyltransferase